MTFSRKTMALSRKTLTLSRKTLSPARVMVLGFLALILLGALLLELPISSRDGVSVPFMTALFTSTSATCITGLAVTDTAQTWSFFGQTVILCLIQIGGLGFMSITTIFFFIMNKNIGLSQRLLIVNSLNLKDMQGVVRLVRHVLIGTFVFEGVGAVVLWLRFLPEYGVWKGLGMGVFHSVSAFCNAGFDVMGDTGAFSSLTAYTGDAAVSITVMALIFIGGLGFFVWEDVWRNRRFRKLHLHSKLVLTVSLGLVALGWVFFYITERTNPETLGAMSFPDAALASLFQAVTPRSGGLCTLDQASFTGVSMMMTMLLMLIGGSAGSTAGGIKNVTAGILFLSAISSLQGKSRLSVFGRTVPAPQIVGALSILLVVLTAILAGSSAIALIQPELPFSGILFETLSAIATCGLSLGITPSLGPASMAIMILFMFFGRVGIITLGMAAFRNRGNVEKTKYPDTWIMMG
ncbi:MAG: potassium uptake protein, TrkH family [Peptococcaceae bacterium]|nr:potassium uptake protein, TrkH family [Peptococcaceae bacterium]